MRNNQKIKQCKCGETNLKNFHKNKSSKDGLSNICKCCDKKKNRKYRETINGVIVTLYNHQKENSKRRGHNPPEYSKEELKEWIITRHNFSNLWEDWVASGYEKDLSLSVDRLEDDLGYSFDNIQLTTWEFNRSKAHTDKKEKYYSLRDKIVIQYSKSGLFIKEYSSVVEASKNTDIIPHCIIEVCKNNREFAGDYKWEYKEEKIL